MTTVRDRRPADWATDLAGRHGLENQFAAALGAHPELVVVRRSTHSLDALDYDVVGPGERLAQVELKAKRQPYQGWAALRPELAERNVFLLDELALRKIIDGGRYAYLVVADLPSRRWWVWSTVELVLASKLRTVRALATGTTRLKAKVLLDLAEAGFIVDSPTAATEVIAASLVVADRQWSAIEPWPHGPVVHQPTRRRRTS